jgi:hypothetical protein
MWRIRVGEENTIMAGSLFVREGKGIGPTGMDSRDQWLM